MLTKLVFDDRRRPSLQLVPAHTGFGDPVRGLFFSSYSTKKEGDIRGAVEDSYEKQDLSGDTPLRKLSLREDILGA